jgi:branched-chain amino acid transport system substrate-binding protein
MKSRKIVSAAVASAIVAGTMLIPGVSLAQEPEVIRIYSSLPLTGSSAGQTTTIVNAINLAIEQKTKGGLVCDGKFKIDYVSLDDATAAKGQWDEAKEQENANKAVADPDAMVYIGTFNSGAAKISIPILNQANPPLAMISPANTNVGLTKVFNPGEPEVYYPTGKRNYMRVVTADDVQGSVGAKWAKSLGARNVYILDDQQVYGKGLADVFEKTAKEIGLNVLGRDGIDGKAADYKALATKIKATNPQLIYYAGITQNNAGQLLKDIRAAGIKALFMGPDGILEKAFIEAAGADVANGVLATIAGTPRNRLPAAGRKFYTDYVAKFKSQPEAYAIYGYESASIALNAISKVCEKDRQAILDAMLSTKNFNGVLGRWSFTPTGDTTLADMLGNRVVNGEWRETGLLKFP